MRREIADNGIVVLGCLPVVGPLAANVMTRPPGQAELRFEGTSTVHVTSVGPDGSKTTTTLQRVE